MPATGGGFDFHAKVLVILLGVLHSIIFDNGASGGYLFGEGPNLFFSFFNAH
jgi:hypothetical protein